MKKNIILSLIVSVSIISSLTSCEVDNYKEPDGRLTGSVIDRVTGNPIISEPYGFRIELAETSWSNNPKLEYVKVKPDGTYNHDKIHAATYEVKPIEGPFLIPETQTVQVNSKATVNVNFTVTPYISFQNVSIVKERNKVKATFTLLKNVETANPVGYRVLVSSKTPHVGVKENGFDTEYSTVELPLKNEDFGVSKVVELNKLVQGKTYYIRIAARCENPSNSNNFTEIVKIQM